MTNEHILKTEIQNALGNFASGKLGENTRALFNTLGYHSSRTLELAPNTLDGLLTQFDPRGFNRKNALGDEWRSVDIVFQLTDDEINVSPQARMLFDPKSLQQSNLHSYLILAIGLKRDLYTRTELANITREVNKLFDMPALILFQHGATLTLAVIDRRPHKRQAEKDVLQKVTLIKDIRIPNPAVGTNPTVGTNPHRAHLEILWDLALTKLAAQPNPPTNWDDLHAAWRKALDTSELNKKFFKELANWFYWAKKHVTFPNGAGKDADERGDDSIAARALIRLLTRLIFTWFIREKSWVPDVLFDEASVKKMLKDELEKNSSSYYRAVLQNLFFATLNTPMNRDERDSREFRGAKHRGVNQDYLVPNKYRYADLFRDPDAFLRLCADIPFLNGGLFQSLDRELEKEELEDAELVARASKEGKQTILRVDGFSERPDNPLRVPNFLFFSAERKVDLNKDFDTKNKDYVVRGLISLLERYKFTVDENTPIEEEVALDPELLGKVFENLLAAYNPETGVTARKQTGSFYTPREIVNYMVDEALVAYLETRLQDPKGFSTVSPIESRDAAKTLRVSDNDARLRHLLSYTTEPPQFSDVEKRILVNALDDLKLLDPACGSGAFPMGALHKLVHILRKLDPRNLLWKEKQIATANQIAIEAARVKALEEIELTFARGEDDYARKLYLIQNCIFGVDIQPIAVQIAKLRCFISLVVDERLREDEPNRGVLPLPNLETKFVAANSLIGLEQPKQASMSDYLVKPLRDQLEQSRREGFSDRTYAKKKKRRDQDRKLRREIAAMLKKDGWGSSTAEQLAAWDPYDQNTHAAFFDAEWMFGVEDGFDVVIGNPPYGAELDASEITLLDTKFSKYKSATKNSAIYFTYFGNDMLTPKGTQSFIVPKSICYSMGWNKCAAFIIQDLTRIMDIGKAFENVKLEQVVFVRPKMSQSDSFINGLFENNLVEEFGTVSKSIFEKYKVLLAGQTREEIKIVQRILNNFNRTFGEYVSIERGLNWQSQVAKHRGKTPVYRGAHLDKYVLNEATDFVSLSSFSKDEYAYQLKSKILNQLAIAHVQNPYPHFYLQAALDEDGSKVVFETISCTFVRSSDLNTKFVLGINNSKLFAWLLYKFIYSNAIRSTRYDAEYVSRIPVPRFEEMNQQPIVHLVDRILAAKRADVKHDTTAWEREIDEMVYQLYGLSDEEIAIVEGGEGRLDHETRER
jgi:hypothetical protein